MLASLPSFPPPEEKLVTQMCHQVDMNMLGNNPNMTQIVTQIFHQVDMNVWITPKYDMNMSGNIKLTKLLGPSLSPRCALINETCEKENNGTAGKTENTRFDDSSQARVHLQSSYERNMNNLALYQPVDLENPVNCYSSNAVLGTANKLRLLVKQNPKSKFTHLND